MVCAIEDAGFEIRDTLMWLYGTGFPKSHDVSKGIDARLLTGSGRTEDMRKLAMGANYEPSGRGRVNFDHGGGSAMNGANEPWTPRTPEAAAWEGWGTALKPAFEPIVMARKPLIGTVAANVLAHGTGAINVDGCRVSTDETITATRNTALGRMNDDSWQPKAGVYKQQEGGRFPANVLHDGSDEVVSAFPHTKSGKPGVMRKGRNDGACYGAESRPAGTPMTGFGDEGSAARFFWSPKASKADRADSKHPTVKPVALMRYLCRLVTPPGGTVLDPFAGSGTTGQAALAEGFDAILIEREAEYQNDIRRRLGLPQPVENVFE